MNLASSTCPPELFLLGLGHDLSGPARKRSKKLSMPTRFPSEELQWRAGCIAAHGTSVRTLLV